MLYLRSMGCLIAVAVAAALVLPSAAADGPTIQTSAGGGVRPDRSLKLVVQATGESVQLSAWHELKTGETPPAWLATTSWTVAASRNPSLEVVVAPPEDAQPQQFTFVVGATDSDGLTSQAEIAWQVLAPLCSGSLQFDRDGTCAACPAHSVPNVAKTRCRPCAANTERPASASACAACPTGLVSEAGAGCRCPSASRVKDGACIPCPPHYDSRANAYNCAKCPAGQQRLANMNACQACPAGQVSESGAACALPTLTLSVSPASLDESAGAQTVTVRAAASVKAASPLAIALVFGGTASASDYAVAGTTTIAIARGDHEGSTTLTITPVDDGVADDNETIEIGAALASHAVVAATASIEEPAPALALSTTPTWIGESSGAQQVAVTVRAHAVLGTALTVPLTLRGTATASTDYAVAGQRSVVIASSTRTAVATLTITPVDDGVADDGETIVFAAAVAGYSTAAATLAVKELPPAIALAVAPSELDEDGGVQAVTVEAKANAVVGAALTVPLDISGTAALGVDYAVAGTRSIVIAAGSKTGSTTLMVMPMPDALDDDSETIEITAAMPGYAVGSATLKILDPLPSLQLSVSPSAVAESGGAQSVVVTAHRDEAAGSRLAVPLTFGGTASTGADYAIGGARSIAIAANRKSGTATLIVTPVADAIKDGGETIAIGATLEGYDVQTATLTIAEPPPAIALSVSPAEIREYAGAQIVTVTATADGPVDAAATVALTLGGTAAAATDYAANGILSITIATGQTSAATVLAITPVADSIADDGETIVVAGTAAGYRVAAATLTIAQPTIVLSVASASLSESAGTVAVTLSIVNPPSSGTYRRCRLEVVPSALDTAVNRVDYRLSTVTARLRADENWRAQLGLTVLPDALSEATETFTLRGRCGGTGRRTSPRHKALDWRPLQLRIVAGGGI